MKRLLLAGLAVVACAAFLAALATGDKVEVLWQGKWYPATVKTAEDSRWFITYDGFGAEWDEWVGGERIRARPVTSRVRDTARTRRTDRRESASTGTAVRGAETMWDCAYSPDGVRVAAAGASGKVYLYTMPGFVAAGTLTTGAKPLRSLAFRPDGQRLAAGGDDGQVRIYDPAARQLLRSFTVGESVLRLAWSPDGRHIAVSGAPAGQETQNGVFLYDAETGSRVRVLVAPAATERHVAVDLAFAGGKLAVGYANQAKGIDVIDVESGRRTLRIDTPGDVNGLAFSPDGAVLCAACYDKRTVAWDANSGRQLRTFEWGGEYATGLAIDAGGKYLAACGRGKGNSAKVFVLATGRLVGGYGASNPVGNAIRFRLDGKAVLVAGTAYGDVFLQPVLQEFLVGE